MLLEAVTLDAAMTAKQALRRLAQHGYWLDPNDKHVRAWLEEFAARIRQADKKFSAADAAEVLERSVHAGRVAIRRQVGATIFWYARRVQHVLQDLHSWPPETNLTEALRLHEYTSDPSEQAARLDGGRAAEFSGVVLNGQLPVAVGEVALTLGRPKATTRGAFGTRDGVGTRDSFVKRPQAKAKEVEIRAHPLLEAPREVVVGTPFDFVIGLSDTPVAGVQSSGTIRLSAPGGAETLPVELQVIADGFKVAGSWRRNLEVSVAHPTAARATFRLTALEQQEDVRTSALVVHFVVDGQVRGSASRHVIVERKKGMAGVPDARGTQWQDAELPAAGLVLTEAGDPADIEVDIAKPDGNASKGSYKCVIRNAHGVPVPDEPLDIDLGDDAKTFAKSLMDQIWRFSNQPLVDQLLAGVGATVSAQLPEAFWSTLDAVAKKVQGRPVTLQLNSAEPYVPWELAFVKQPLDKKRPQYLGAQVVMGRWILGDAQVTSPPRQTLSVKAMAVVAGMYNKKESQLNRLPEAEKEAAELTKSYATMPAIRLDCTPDNLQSLLTASLTHKRTPVGGVQAVHFAGHGYTDPTRPGDSALYFSNGQPFSPMFFRNTKLGLEHQPFIFLNACMVGAAGEMLGDVGGFPGNCLAGGFTALLAPLWIVHDDVARDFALEFYRNALNGKADRSVAEVIRDLRANYDSSKPNATYLAYVYYGNPSLKLSQAGS